MTEICSLCKTNIHASEAPALNSKTGELAHVACMKGRADIYFYNEVPNMRPSRLQMLAQRNAPAAPAPAPVVQAVAPSPAAAFAREHHATAHNYWTQAIDGTPMEVFNLAPGMIKPSNIAHALSNICRYTGHTKRFYSVAQHSLAVSHAVKLLGGGLKAQLWGLMHDAGESYLSDIAAPLKRHPIFEGYRLLEAEVDRRIRARFGLNIMHPSDLAMVKLVDAGMVTPEKLELLAEPQRSWGVLPEVPECYAGFIHAQELHDSEPDVSKLFMERFHELNAAMQAKVTQVLPLATVTG